MRGYHSYLICVVDGQVGIYEDKKVGYGFGEGKGFGESMPCYRIGIKDDGEKRGRRAYVAAIC
jgi:hypothetical protein